MATKFDVEKIKYKKALNSFYEQYNRFRNENVKKTSCFTFDVTVKEPVELYMAVGDLIHQAAILVDTGIDTKKIKGRDRSFISAIRFIDNLIKHEKQEIIISDLMSSTPKMMGNGLDENNHIILEMEVESYWKEIPPIEIKPENKNQKNNYDFKIKGKTIIESMSMMNEILEKYITFDQE